MSFDRIPKVKDIAPETEGVTAISEEPRVQKAEKPKRKVTRPSYLKDYA